MANEEHLARLKQGVPVWNAWRSQDPTIRPDLVEANLSEADLYRVDLFRANLVGADLSEANLSEADLSGADLSRADLSGADLSGADLSEAELSGATFVGADLSQADFFRTYLYMTVFGNVDLSTVQKLEMIRHRGPSIISIDTLYRSHGNISEVFLRGAGVPDDMITYIKSLVGRPFEFYSCFISYSSKDQEFAERLYADLQSKNVRCWFAPEDLKIGEKFRTSIDEAIRIRDKLLLVLSNNSITSEWVETEVETALEEEHRRKKTILFPIRLDDSVIETRQAWAANIRQTRHIGDFQQWKDHDAYQHAFQRLLRDLKAGI